MNSQLCGTIPAGAGLPDRDFLLYVTAKATPLCASGVLAYAIGCKHDLIERPTMGRTNFCPLSINLGSRATLVATAVHEILHALGFSASYFWRWRNAESLQPLTPREFGFDGPPASPHVGVCSNSLVYFPGPEVADTFSERGLQQCSSLEDRFTASNCVSKIVTPTSVSAARWFTGCPSLNGIELENHVLGSCHSTGSHLEQRLFENNLMAPFLSASSEHRLGLSAPVLAIMQDSGWYRANWTAQDVFVPHADWAFKQGCKFATDTCISPQQTVPPQGEGRFCTDASQALCSSDHKWRAVCNIRNFASDLPTAYQYFSNPRRGGVEKADYCPIVQSLQSGDCTDASGLLPSERLGSQQGPSSRCFPSTAISASFSSTPTSRTGQCMRVQCELDALVPGGVAARVFFFTSAGEQSNVLCTAAGSITAPNNFRGEITCPDPQQICGLPAEPFIPEAAAAPSSFASPTASPSVSSSGSVSATPASTMPSSASSVTASPSATASVSVATGSATCTVSPSATASVSVTTGSATCTVSPSATALASVPPAAGSDKTLPVQTLVATLVLQGDFCGNSVDNTTLSSALASALSTILAHVTVKLHTSVVLVCPALGAGSNSRRRLAGQQQARASIFSARLLSAEDGAVLVTSLSLALESGSLLREVQAGLQPLLVTGLAVAIVNVPRSESPGGSPGVVSETKQSSSGGTAPARSVAIVLVLLACAVGAGVLVWRRRRCWKRSACCMCMAEQRSAHTYSRQAPVAPWVATSELSDV